MNHFKRHIKGAHEYCSGIGMANLATSPGEQMYHKYQFFETNDLLNIGQLSSAWQNTTSCIYLYKLKNLFCQVSSLS